MKGVVRMVFVAGADGLLAGVVTADLLQGERPVLRASNHHVAHKDLTVADMMIPINHWEVLDLSQNRLESLPALIAAEIPDGFWEGFRALGTPPASPAA